LLLGNTIQAEFHPSGQVRNEHSLNRWGFKIQVRPLYGLQKSQLRKTLKEGETATIMKRFKSIDNVVLWVNTMRVLSSVIIENVLSLIGMEELRTPVEQSNSALLKWTLLKNGLVNFNMEDHLIKQPSNGNLTLVNKLEFS
jgi:other hect domain ubiquitin protein ligase E3